MKYKTAIKCLSKDDCAEVCGGNLVSIGRWAIGSLAGGMLYDGVKSGVSSAYAARNSLSAYIIGSYFKTP